MENKTEIVSKLTPELLAKCKFPLIVIYDNPSDFPGKYVARLWDMDKSTVYAVVAGSLAEIRNAIPKTMTCIGRTSQDDPCILETWI